MVLISERGCLVRTLMRTAWKASRSSGMNEVVADGDPAVKRDMV